MKWRIPSRLRELCAQEKQRANLLLLAGMAGILLLGLSEFFSAPAKETGTPEATACPAPSGTGYARELEQRLGELLCQVEGAGRVKVMLTLAAEGTTVYAKDLQQYADGSGQENHVLLEGDPPALVETVTMPAIRGVAVLCEGGNSARVQQCITQIVDALTGVGASHITVTGMVTPSEGG